MKRTLAPWLLAGTMAATWLGGCGSKPSPQPGPHTNSSNSNQTPNKAAKTATGRLKVIAFYDQSMGTVTPDPFALAKAHPGLVTDLSPFWYEVSSTGSIISKPEGNAATLARQDHLPLEPLFNNAGGNDTFLHSQSTRATAIKNIVNLVKSKKYAGVHIDFQLLKPGDRKDLTAFMQELKKAMPAHTAIAMSVVPLTSGNGHSSAYDFAALDKSVNAIALMAYDLHGDGTPPGPVAPYNWVKSSIQRALKAGISPSKLYLGIANYGYLWTNGSTKAKTIPIKAMHQHKYGKYKWNASYKEAYDKYTSNGATHIIWFENDRAATERIALAKKYHLGGIAIWRVGYGDAKFWTAVSNAVGHKSTLSSIFSPSPTKGSNTPGGTMKKAGQKAKNNVTKPTKKSIIAPKHKTKNSNKKTS